MLKKELTGCTLLPKRFKKHRYGVARTGAAEGYVTAFIKRVER